MYSLTVRVTGIEKTAQQLQRIVVDRAQWICIVMAEAIKKVSQDRLAGKYGAIFSHQYYHEELGTLVDRYKIKHDQTHRLIENMDVYPSNGGAKMIAQMSYAGDIAELDDEEINENAWLYAIRIVTQNFGNMKNIRDMHALHII